MNFFSSFTSKLLIWVGLILVPLGIAIFIYYSNIDSEKVGQFGDIVGGLVGSIWALAGVILFYVALSEQQKDIRINREVLATQVKALNKQIEEFELQRFELEHTRKVFIEQSKTLKIQQFESTFFSMLTLHHGIVNSIDVSISNNSISFGARVVRSDSPIKTITSRDCFEHFYHYLSLHYDKNPAGVDENIHDHINRIYFNLYEKYQSDIGHYFRNLYNILKFIDQSEMESKFLYSNLLRAQLSSNELLLLFYNCLSTFGKEKFKPLIEKYCFFQNMPKNSLLDCEKHQRLYEKSAYEKKYVKIDANML